MHHLLILVEKAASILSQPNSFISVEKGYQQNTSIKLSFIAHTIEGFNLQVQLLKVIYLFYAATTDCSKSINHLEQYLA